LPFIRLLSKFDRFPGNVRRLFGGLSGFFGIPQAFARERELRGHKAELPQEESRLSQSNDHKPESEKPGRIMNEPVPQDAIGVVIAGLWFLCAV
jgi:hypothetical protein